jgi:hypothetical protein
VIAVVHCSVGGVRASRADEVQGRVAADGRAQHVRVEAVHGSAQIGTRTVRSIPTRLGYVAQDLVEFGELRERAGQ